MQTVTYGGFHDGEVDLVELGSYGANLVAEAASGYLVDVFPLRGS